MAIFAKPKNLNGSELRTELRNQGIVIDDHRDAVRVDEDTLILEIDENDAQKAETIVKNHDGTTIAQEPTIADKLALAGLTLDELKAAILA